jgi:accessory gene regulator B
MIENAAEKIAQKIKDANPQDTASVEVMKYSLIAVIGTGSAIAFSMLFSTLLGTLIETLLTIFAFVSLRSISGGYHFKTAEACTLSSIIGAVALPLIPLDYYMGIGLMIASIMLFAWLAPIGINQSRIFSAKHYPFLKLLSILLVASNFLFMSDILTKAFFVQAITLLIMKGGEKNEKTQQS